MPIVSHCGAPRLPDAQDGGGAGDSCFKDGLPPRCGACTWLPLSIPCCRWLPGLSVALAHFVLHALVFHLRAARGNGAEGLVGEGVWSCM